MNYISLLTQGEIEILCNLVSGKRFKALFQKKSKEFSKIKPGFRPNGISEKDAVSLGIKYIDKPFISSFVNTTVEIWLKEIEEFYTNLASNGRNGDEALAETLSGSWFSANLSLYFKLIGKDIDEAYLAKLREHMADIAALAGENKLKEHTPQSEAACKAEDFRKQLNIYENQIQSLKDANASMEQELAAAQASVHDLLQDKQKMEAELADFRARIQYDDTEKVPATIESHDFDYISLCEVLEPDYKGQVRLNRLADIRKNGTIEAFYEDENMPNYFGNRTKIFSKDGPNESGTIGVWSWKSTPSNNDLSRDYVTSEFNSAIEPIEIIVIQECKTDKELIEKIKAGVDVEITSRRVVFAAYLSKGQYVGVLCRYSDLEQAGRLTKLNKKVISLPKYDISGRDITNLSNGKTYYRSISIGIPSEIVNVKDPMDIVKTVILARNSWQLFKQQGKTRSEWKNMRDFLDGLDTTLILDDIVSSANCSHSEATKMLSDFIEYAQSYIDGTSIEDKILSAAIASNPELMKRCKSLIMDEWITENKASVDEANAQLDGLQREIKEVQGCIEKQKAEAEKELAAVKEKHDGLSAELQTLSEGISEKEKLAADVEVAVAQRIRQAQNNAADFIATLAFAPKATLDVPENIAASGELATKTHIEDMERYVSGTELNPDNLEIASTWLEMLNTISGELVEAGVTSKLSLPLAAYMYAAYITKSPLLMVGPNADAVVDAFSGAVCGRMAGTLDCTENYSTQSVKACYASEDRIVKIVNPFSSNWIGRIPDIVSKGDKFYIAVYPYSEDLQIEPKSLYSYMLPLLTELFIENEPTGRILGGCSTKYYKEFPLAKTTRSYIKILTKMRTSVLVRSKIQMLLSNMHSMLNDQDHDYDVIFALLPYAYATMQTSLILDAVQDGEKRAISISKSLSELINALYGENE